MILDKTDYHNEMFRLLNDVNTYSQFQRDPTTSYKKEFAELVEKELGMGILEKKERAYLVPLAPRIFVMYYLPKVHKDPIHPLFVW